MRFDDDAPDRRHRYTQRLARRRKRQSALIATLVASIVGILAGGYLTWRERATNVEPSSPAPSERTEPTALDISNNDLSALHDTALLPPALEQLTIVQNALAVPPAPTSAPSSSRSRHTSPEPRSRAATKPEPAIGHLSLEATPLANVYLGDRLLGATPLVARELPSGLTPLRLVDPVTGHEQTVVIDIPKGGDVHRKVSAE